MEGVFYWIALVIYLLLIKFLSIKSGLTLTLAFLLFLIAVVFVLVTLVVVGEILMRTSLIFWLVGLGQTLLERE